MVDKHSGLWDQCLRKIEGKIEADTYGTWFAQTSSSQLDANLAVIEVPTSFFVDWLEEHWLDLIRSTIQEITSWTPEIRFSVKKIRSCFRRGATRFLERLTNPLPSALERNRSFQDLYPNPYSP